MYHDKVNESVAAYVTNCFYGYVCNGCRLGLDVSSISRRINVSSRSRLDKNFQRLGLVSAIDISCPRPIFHQILQVIILKLALPA